MSRAPVLVCFDLGGVIVRICGSWEEGCTRAGLPRRAVRPEPTVLRQLEHEHQTGVIGIEAYACRMSAHLGGRYSPEEVIAVHEAWVIGPYADLVPLIDRLHERGVTTAALSNTNAHHWARLPQITPIARLGHRFASHELGLRKPDPAIYRELERRLECTGPDILFFDDLPENVDAARSVGWSAVQIDPDRETGPQITAALREHGLA